MSDWRTVTIAEIAAEAKNALATGPFGSAISSRFFRESGVPVIRGGNLSLDVGQRLNENELVFLDEAKASEFDRSIATTGDLVFTCWGTIGQVGLIDERSKYERYIVSNKQMKLTPDRNIADSLFLYYVLSSPNAVAQIQNAAIGSSVPGFNLSQLRRMLVRLPLVPEQRAIAGVLGALDDKIVANERTATTAAHLAHALFLQVQQNASFSCAIGNHIDLVYGKALREPDRRPGPVPVFGCTGQVGWHDSALSVGPCAVVGRKGANAGYVSWSPAPCWVIDTAFYVQMKSSLLTNEYSYFLLKDANLSKLVGDSAIPGLNRSAALDQVVAVPDSSQIRAFTAQARPLLSAVSLMAEQNQSLSAMRDALLPKLMSGEIRVRDAEKVVEHAT